jgi:hypothetical protein
MKRALVIAVVLLSGAVISCRDRSAPSAGQLTVDGRAELVTAGGGVQAVGSGRTRTLRPGERVRVLEGTAMLSLGGGSQVELRRDASVQLAFRSDQEELRPAAQLIAGDVLIVASDGGVTVRAAETDLTVRGTARLSRGLAVLAGSYQGSIEIESAGKRMTVPALRQVTIPAAGLLPARPSPLTFSPSDPWDQRFLGEGIELGNQLVATSRGFTAQLAPGEGTTPGFYRLLLPELEREPAFTESLLTPPRPPGEVLVGAAIAVEGQRGTFRERWADIFGFRDEGAPWGLVALDQGVSRSPLIARIEAAIGRAPSLAQASTGQGGTSGTGGGGTGGGGAGGGGTGGGGTGGGGTGGGGSVGTTQPGRPPISLPPEPTTPGPGGTTVPTTPLERTRGVDLGLPVVDDTLNSLVDALGGLLRALSTPPPP